MCLCEVLVLKYRLANEKIEVYKIKWDTFNVLRVDVGWGWWSGRRETWVPAACEEDVTEWGSSTDRPTDSFAVLLHQCLLSVQTEQSICFRPVTLSPGLRRQLAGWHHRGCATWTLPGSSASDYAMRRGNVGTTRVISAATATLPRAGRPATSALVSTCDVELSLYNKQLD